MGWGRFPRALVAAAGLLALTAAPVLAHGDHDARPLARDVEAGPYLVSLWQVYPDTGATMTPVLIVMLKGAAIDPAADVRVAVDAAQVPVRPSTTTANGWETATGIAEGNVLAVTVSDASGSWDLDPVVVPPPPTSVIPMPELIYTSIFLSFATACWIAARTARTWRQPAAATTQQPVTGPA